MRKIIHAIFVISALVALVLCSACVFPSFEEQKIQDGGPVQVAVPVESSRISFDVALQNLKNYQEDSSKGSESVKRIYYILAKDVDGSGNAISWVFGVNYGTGNKLLIYEKNGWTIFSKSNTTLPSNEIDVDRIISPTNLFSNNKDTILSIASSANPEMRDLELQQGNYTLTLYTGNTTKILAFNAYTGMVIT
jgi:hypothetical protein